VARTHPAPASLPAQLEPDQPVYLLIDPIVGDFLPQLAFADTDDAESIRAAREDVYGRRIVPIPLAPGIPLPASRHPYLVAMAAMDDPWLAASQEMALDQHETTCAFGLAGTGWGSSWGPTTRAVLSTPAPGQRTPSRVSLTCAPSATAPGRRRSDAAMVRTVVTASSMDGGSLPPIPGIGDVLGMP
jgi:hypothetical protein